MIQLSYLELYLLIGIVVVVTRTLVFDYLKYRLLYTEDVKRPVELFLYTMLRIVIWPIVLLGHAFTRG